MVFLFFSGCMSCFVILLPWINSLTNPSYTLRNPGKGGMSNISLSETSRQRFLPRFNYFGTNSWISSTVLVLHSPPPPIPTSWCTDAAGECNANAEGRIRCILHERKRQCVKFRSQSHLLSSDFWRGGQLYYFIKHLLLFVAPLTLPLGGCVLEHTIHQPT